MLPEFNKDIIKADPAARKKAIILIIVFLVIGTPIMYYFEIFIKKNDELMSKDPNAAVDQIKFFINLFIPIQYLSFFSMSAYIFLFSKKISSSGQCPPPGVKVIRDTSVIKGRKARGIAIGGYIFSIFLIAFAFYFHWVIWWCLSR